MYVLVCREDEDTMSLFSSFFSTALLCLLFTDRFETKITRSYIFSILLTRLLMGIKNKIMRHKAALSVHMYGIPG